MACYSKTTHVFGSGFQARTQVFKDTKTKADADEVSGQTLGVRMQKSRVRTLGVPVVQVRFPSVFRPCVIIDGL
jgi:hypothetical protein